jgi:hypothetical protein
VRRFRRCSDTGLSVCAPPVCGSSAVSLLLLSAVQRAGACGHGWCAWSVLVRGGALQRKMVCRLGSLPLRCAALRGAASLLAPAPRPLFLSTAVGAAAAAGVLLLCALPRPVHAVDLACSTPPQPRVLFLSLPCSAFLQPPCDRQRGLCDTPRAVGSGKPVTERTSPPARAAVRVGGATAGGCCAARRRWKVRAAPRRASVPACQRARQWTVWGLVGCGSGGRAAPVARAARWGAAGWVVRALPSPVCRCSARWPACTVGGGRAEDWNRDEPW